MSNPNIYKYGFKKGQSGNPKGASKKEWTMKGLIKEALEEQDEKGVPYKKTIARKLTKLAHAGDLGAIKEINNRIDGMAKQITDITSGGEKLQYNITDDQLTRIIKNKEDHT